MQNNSSFIAIVNVTPDSFSDGGKYNKPEQIIQHVENLLNHGADVIDIGAQSTRPDASIISDKKEWQRLEPVLAEIIKLTHSKNKLVSLDSYHPTTIEKALALGVDFINDVSGFNNDEIVSLVKGSNCGLMVMHSLSVPSDKDIILPENKDAIELVLDWAINKIEDLQNSGIDKSRIIIDPGIGFGKNAKQSWNLIKNISRLKQLDVKLLVGHSRKSFIESDADKDLQTLAISDYLVDMNIDYIRIHNMQMHDDFFITKNETTYPRG